MVMPIANVVKTDSAPCRRSSPESGLIVRTQMEQVFLLCAPDRWRPIGERTRVVSVKPSQSNGISFKKAQGIDIKYLELIPTEAVLEAVDELFKLC